MFFKHIVLISAFIAFVHGEGYYCPYDSLGYDGKNDLLYDYYEGNGDYWVRMGRTGWETRESYCRAKGDLSLHNDAGEAKCIDSQGTCRWNGNSCEVNPLKEPDCFELCKAVHDGKGLSCLGNCPNGSSSRDELYSICNAQESQQTLRRPSRTRNRKIPRQTTTATTTNITRTKQSEPITFKSKKLSCICQEEL